MKAKYYNDTHNQALNYATADKSDPFTYSRIMSHIKSGLCDDAVRGIRLDEARYTAEPYLETRKLPPSPQHPEGQEYTVTCYKNLRRP